MKKILTMTVVCLCLTHLSYSQEYFTKGSNIITGGFNIVNSNETRNYDYSQTQVTTNKTGSYGLSANYGRFIKDNLVIGAGLNYSYSLSESITEYEDSTQYNFTNEYLNKGFGANVFIRKYFPVNEKFGAYISSSVYYNFYENFRGNNNDEWYDKTETNSVGLNAGLGIYYFILNRLSLSVSLGQIGFSYGSTKEADGYDSSFQDSKRTSFHLDLVNQISFEQFLTINFHF